MDADFKKLVDTLQSSLVGIVAISTKAIEKSLEDLAKVDPVAAEAKAKEYAQAMKSANVPDKVKDLAKKIKEL